MSKLNFPTQFERQRVFSNVGSPIKTTFQLHYNEDGTEDLVESGTIDLYAMIQADADTVDIYNIVKRFENGDPSVLSRVQGTYGDFTEMPKNYAEVLNVAIKARADFDSLPVETRANFNHSFEQYLSTVGQEGWFEKLGIKKEVPVEPIEKEIENAAD